MNKRLATPVLLVAGLVAAAAPFASASDAPGQPPNCPIGCQVDLTANGPSPSTLTMHAGGGVLFFNSDSVSHTVVFANGLCSITLAPGTGGYDGGSCDINFPLGSYAYSVDGKFAGALVVTPWPRSVSLTARSHTIRGGTRLTLHGRVVRSNSGAAPPPRVVVLARHGDDEPFKPVATVRTKGAHETTYGWKLNVRPAASTTYIAEVTTQRTCYYPASRCAHPQRQFWANAESRPFIVRVRSR